MADTILIIRAVYPDGSHETRKARVAPDGSRQVRLNFHQGRLTNKATELTQLRMSAADPPCPALKAGSGNGSAAAGTSPSKR